MLPNSELYMQNMDIYYEFSNWNSSWTHCSQACVLICELHEHQTMYVSLFNLHQTIA